MLRSTREGSITVMELRSFSPKKKSRKGLIVHEFYRKVTQNISAVLHSP